MTNTNLYDLLANDAEAMEMVEKEYQRELAREKEMQEFYRSLEEERNRESDRAIKEALDNEHGADDVNAFLASRFFVKE